MHSGTGGNFRGRAKQPAHVLDYAANRRDVTRRSAEGGCFTGMLLGGFSNGIAIAAGAMSLFVVYVGQRAEAQTSLWVTARGDTYALWGFEVPLVVGVVSCLLTGIAGLLLAVYRRSPALLLMTLMACGSSVIILALCLGLTYSALIS
jgi:hypothetical protein